MRFLSLLTLTALLLHSANAKKKESYAEDTFNEVYAHAAEATEKLGKISIDAYHQAKKAIDESEASRMAIEALSGAATVVTEASKTIGQVSGAAFAEAKRSIESGEAAKVASEFLAGAAAVATDTAKTIGQASAHAYQHVKKSVETGEAEQVASEALANAASLANILAERAAEVWKGRQKNETYTEFVGRVKQLFSFRKQETVEEDEKQKDEQRIFNVATGAAMGQASGVFRQVNKYGEPIYKHVSGGDWGMRQINAVGEAIYKPSMLGNVFTGVGKVFWYVAAAMESMNIAEATAKDLDEGTTNHTTYAVSKAVLTWTGASVGAGMGSAIPVIGTLAGGIVGGFIGAYSGSIAGEAAADAFMRHVDEGK